jgi:hypothetical protein
MIDQENPSWVKPSEVQMAGPLKSSSTANIAILMRSTGLR